MVSDLDGGVTSVLANDIDVDGPSALQVLTVATTPNSIATPNGSMQIAADGTFTYTHDGSETLSDFFDYTVSDGADPRTARVNITIIPVSDAPPVANPDSATVFEGGSVSVLDNGATSVLANDTDEPDNSPLSVVNIGVNATDHGSVNLLANGEFTYTHDGSETTSDLFVYNVTDGTDVRAANVTITVIPVSDAPPVANPDIATVDEGGTINTVDVLANDTDADLPADTLSASTDSGPSNGTLTLASGGLFTYTHDGSETTTDSFDYVVSDGVAMDVGTVNITINPVNDPPIVLGDIATVEEGGTISITTSVLANDSDADGPNALQVLSVATMPNFIATNNGSVQIDANGFFTYTHDGSETTTDFFDYTVSDGADARNARVNVTVIPVSDAPPLAVPDSATAPEGGQVSVLDGGAISVLANDSDVPDNSPLSVINTGVHTTDHGSVNLLANGEFTYTHDGSETIADSFVYSVTDGTDVRSTTVSITILPANAVPVAVDDGGVLDDVEFAWANAMGGTSSDEGVSIAVDSLGNIYTTGGFIGTVNFDPDGDTANLTSAGIKDIFVSKQDSDGNFVWAKRMGGAGFEIGNGIAVDNLDNIYSTGFFRGTLDFDPDVGVFNLTSAGDADIFISKLDSAGNFVWAKKMGGTGPENVFAIAVDSSGNVTTTGRFQGTADFNPGDGVFNLTSIGGHEIFISKLDSAGNFVWAKKIGGGGFDEGVGIAVDSSENVYTTGSFEETVDFDPGEGTFNLTSAGGRDIFVSKLDSGGNFIWARKIGGVPWELGLSIAVDSSGNVITTGKFPGTVDFDPGEGTFNLTSPGSFDIFVSKLDSAGNFVWAKRMGSTGDNTGESITVDSIGNIYTTGSFQRTVDFDPGVGVFNFTSANYDMFVSKLDGAGNFIWAKQMGGTGGNFGIGIAVNSSGNVYSTGIFEDTVDFDPGADLFNLTSVGGGDIFVSKLSRVNGKVGFVADEQTAITTGDVRINDTDPENDLLSVTGLNTSGTIGQIINNGNGTFDYDPNGQFASLDVGETTTDTFEYTVSDGNGGTAIATVTIVIEGVNDVLADIFGGEPIAGFPGWRASSWYMNYNVDFWPWIYHDEHGWQFISDNSTGEIIFLWDLGLREWLFFNENTYRWVFMFGANEGWIWAFANNTPGSRFFQRIDDGSIFLAP